MILAVRAEVRTMTLREAIDLALKQNPDLMMARLDLTKARLGVKIAHDPFEPKLYGGSGAAYTNGYPATINGNPPSIFQAQASMAILNRQQRYLVAEAQENARGSEIDLTRQQDDIAFRTATLWLDGRQAAQSVAAAHRQVDTLQAVEQTVQARVREGRALEIDDRRAVLDVKKAQQRLEKLTADQEFAEMNLSMALGFGPNDRVRAADEQPAALQLPASAQATVQAAIANSKQIRLLESQIQAKTLEIRSYKAARLPTVDLIAQYNLLAKYNFQDTFTKFQRNNGELGVSITVPLLVGSAPKASEQQGEADLVKLRLRMNQVRDQIALNARKSFEDVKQAETAREVARMDLDLARDQLSVVLAQFDEGRKTMSDVEAARAGESDKWIAFYQAQHDLEKVRLNLLRQTGNLASSLQ
jgi:outer membrane protein TolC